MYRGTYKNAVRRYNLLPQIYNQNLRHACPITPQCCVSSLAEFKELQLYNRINVSTLPHGFWKTQEDDAISSLSELIESESIFSSLSSQPFSSPYSSTNYGTFQKPKTLNILPLSQSEIILKNQLISENLCDTGFSEQSNRPANKNLRKKSVAFKKNCSSNNENEIFSKQFIHVERPNVSTIHKECTDFKRFVGSNCNSNIADKKKKKKQKNESLRKTEKSKNAKNLKGSKAPIQASNNATHKSGNGLSSCDNDSDSSSFDNCCGGCVNYCGGCDNDCAGCDNDCAGCDVMVTDWDAMSQRMGTGCGSECYMHKSTIDNFANNEFSDFFHLNNLNFTSSNDVFCTSDVDGPFQNDKMVVFNPCVKKEMGPSTLCSLEEQLRHVYCETQQNPEQYMQFFKCKKPRKKSNNECMVNQFFNVHIPDIFGSKKRVKKIAAQPELEDRIFAETKEEKRLRKKTFDREQPDKAQTKIKNDLLEKISPENTDSSMKSASGKKPPSVNKHTKVDTKKEAQEGTAILAALQQPKVPLEYMEAKEKGIGKAKKKKVKIMKKQETKTKAETKSFSESSSGSETSSKSLSLSLSRQDEIEKTNKPLEDDIDKEFLQMIEEQIKRAKKASNTLPKLQKFSYGSARFKKKTPSDAEIDMMSKNRDSLYYSGGFDPDSSSSKTSIDIGNKNDDNKHPQGLKQKLLKIIAPKYGSTPDHKTEKTKQKIKKKKKRQNNIDLSAFAMPDEEYEMLRKKQKDSMSFFHSLPTVELNMRLKNILSRTKKSEDVVNEVKKKKNVKPTYFFMENKSIDWDKLKKEKLENFQNDPAVDWLSKFFNSKNFKKDHKRNMNFEEILEFMKKLDPNKGNPPKKEKSLINREKNEKIKLKKKEKKIEDEEEEEESASENHSMKKLLEEITNDEKPDKTKKKKKQNEKEQKKPNKKRKVSTDLSSEELDDDLVNLFKRYENYLTTETESSRSSRSSSSETIKDFLKDKKKIRDKKIKKKKNVDFESFSRNKLLNSLSYSSLSTDEEERVMNIIKEPTKKFRNEEFKKLLKESKKIKEKNIKKFKTDKKIDENILKTNRLLNKENRKIREKREQLQQLEELHKEVVTRSDSITNFSYSASKSCASYTTIEDQLEEMIGDLLQDSDDGEYKKIGEDDKKTKKESGLSVFNTTQNCCKNTKKLRKNKRMKNKQFKLFLKGSKRHKDIKQKKVKKKPENKKLIKKTRKELKEQKVTKKNCLQNIEKYDKDFYVMSWLMNDHEEKQQ